MRDPATKVKHSSKLIMSTVTQLDARIKSLAGDIRSRESRQAGADRKDSFDAAVTEVERGVEAIAAMAQKNLAGCAGVLGSVRGTRKRKWPPR